jgi:UDP-glucose-4-epimerase GalE
MEKVVPSDRGKVLVTGGAGYIGSHCCKALSEAGYQPICYDNLSTGQADFVRWGPLINGDIQDTGKLTDALKDYGVVAVVHFAAFSLVGESVTDPAKYYQNNLAGTLGLLQAMRSVGCLRLVFSSTGAVYGAADSKPIPESFPGRPINPYGASKWMIERVLSDYREAYRLASFSLRYFNACGADASGLVGELHDPETHLIPRALMAIQGHLPQLEIYGDDYDTPDGTAIRDYIHVADLGTAHVLAVEKLLKGDMGASLNLGSGSGFSVKQILAQIKATTGKSVPHTIRGRRAGDPAFLVADPSKAGAVLNFVPRQSDLATIIGSAWAWHQKAHPARAESSSRPG